MISATQSRETVIAEILKTQLETSRMLAEALRRDLARDGTASKRSYWSDIFLPLLIGTGLVIGVPAMVLALVKFAAL